MCVNFAAAKCFIPLGFLLARDIYLGPNTITTRNVVFTLIVQVSKSHSVNVLSAYKSPSSSNGKGTVIGTGTMSLY